MFELLGSAPADAAKKAQVVMAIETALANGSLDRVTRRDPEKVYHKMTVKELADAGARIRLGEVLQSRGRAADPEPGCRGAAVYEGAG